MRSGETFAAGTYYVAVHSVNGGDVEAVQVDVGAVGDLAELVLVARGPDGLADLVIRVGSQQ